MSDYIVICGSFWCKLASCMVVSFDGHMILFLSLRITKTGLRCEYENLKVLNAENINCSVGPKTQGVIFFFCSFGPLFFFPLHKS